jgi:hypothetical protein
MIGVVVEKGSAKKTKYGFRTIFGLNEGRYGMKKAEGGSRKKGKRRIFGVGGGNLSISAGPGATASIKRH